MNAVDGALALLLAVGVWSGARKGLLRQVAALAATAGGLYGANRIAPGLGGGYGAYLGTFAALAVATAVLGRWLGERIARSALAPVDRALGAALGGAKSLLLCYLALYTALCFPTRPLRGALARSIVAPALLRAAGHASLFFPTEFESRAEECVREAALARARRAAPPGEPEPCVVPAAAKPSGGPLPSGAGAE